MGRKEKKYTAERKEFHDHDIRKGQIVSEYITNAQTDTIIHNKTQTDKQEEQPNKGIPKK